MKKFTCLLITLLAISTVYTQPYCSTTASEHTFYQLINDATAYGSATVAVSNSAPYDFLSTDSGTVCGATYSSTAGSNGQLCCEVPRLKTAVQKELTFVRDNLINIAAGVARLGGMWAKVATLVNASTANDTLTAASDADRSGATADQLKAWLYYTPTQFQADFDAFKAQAGGCFTAYSKAINTIACNGCAAQTPTTANATAFVAAESKQWTLESSIIINQAGCNAVVAACSRVYYFLHRFGWFAQGVALLNKKKETTASPVTYTPPASTAVYAPGALAFTAVTGETTLPALTALTFAEINTAITDCGSAATAATGCDDAAKTKVCRAFFVVWRKGENFGRGSTAFVSSSYNPVSTVARRQLPAVGTTLNAATRVSTLTGAIDISSSTNSVDTSITLPTATVDAWSSGYASASGSSSSSSSKSAKVFIGTILSALFAVAFLN